MEEDISSNWTTLSKKQDAINRKEKHEITLCGKLALKEVVGLS